MLSEAVDRHIELYRTMGFKYKVQAYMLHSFADFAQAHLLHLARHIFRKLLIPYEAIRAGAKS